MLLHLIATGPRLHCDIRVCRTKGVRKQLILDTGEIDNNLMGK